jgi:hypothetical protein
MEEPGVTCRWHLHPVLSSLAGPFPAQSVDRAAAVRGTGAAKARRRATWSLSHVVVPDLGEAGVVEEGVK